MAATLEKLVKVRSQLAKAVLSYLTQLATELNLTSWYCGSDRIKAADIAIEQFVYTTRKREKPARQGDERKERDTLIEKQSPMEEIEARRYELPVNVDEYEEVRWRQVIQQRRARIGLKGAPGSGKTFTTRHTMASFALAEAAKLQAHQVDADQVEAPLWVTAKALADIGSADIEDALPNALEQSLQMKLSQLQREWLQRAIFSSRKAEAHLLIVVDALDELQSNDRSAFTTQAKRLDEFNARVIMTCRTMHWEERRDWLGWSGRLEEVELAPFKRRQQREFARKFLKNKPDMTQGMERLLQVNYALRHACTTPLLLTFACLLHEADSVKENTTYAQLYAEITRKLFCGEWRDLKAFKPVWVGSTVKEDRCLHFLEDIAWRLFAKAPELNRFTLDDWVQAADQALQGNRSAPLDSAEFLEQLEKVGLIIPAGVDEQRRDRCWSFAHRTLLEFLSARVLSRMEQGVWLMEAKKHFWFAPEWLEVLTFLAGLVDDATPLIQAISEEEDDLFGSMLYLKARFVGVASEVDEAIMVHMCSEVINYWQETIDGKRYGLGEFAQQKLLALVMNEATRNSNGKVGAVFAGSVLRFSQDEDRGKRRAAAEVLGHFGTPEAVSRLLELSGEKSHVESITERVSLPENSQLELSGEKTHVVSSDVAYAAVKSLGQIGTPEAIVRLVELSRDADSAMYLKAVELLGQVSTPEATARLLEISWSDVLDKRYEAGIVLAKALGQIGTPEAVARLVELSRYKHPLSQQVIFTAPKGLGQLWELKSEEQSAAAAAANALGNIGTPEAVAQLFELSQKGVDQPARQVAAQMLGQIGTPEAITQLLELSQDIDKDVRIATAKALGQVATPEAVARLLELSDPPKREESASTRDSDEFVIITLFEACSSEQDAAIEALGHIGTPEVLTHLLKLSKDGAPVVRKVVAKALGQIRRSEAVACLVEVSNDEDGAIREMVAESFGQIGTPEVLEPLDKLSRDEIHYVRAAVARALGQIGTPDVVSSLLELSRDENEVVHRMAILALGKCERPEAIMPLRKVFFESDLFFNPVYTVIEALWRISWKNKVRIKYFPLSTPNSEGPNPNRGEEKEHIYTPPPHPAADPVREYEESQRRLIAFRKALEEYEKNPSWKKWFIKKPGY